MNSCFRFAIGALLALSCLIPVAAQKPVDLNDHSYVYLLRDTTVTVGEDLRQVTRVHHRIKILRQAAVNVVGDVRLPYNHFRQKPRLVEAFTEAPNGERTVVNPADVERLIPDDFSGYQMYSDAREFVMSMPALREGAVIDYTVEFEEQNPIISNVFFDVHTFVAAAPVLTSRYAIVGSENVDLVVHEQNMPRDVERTGRVKVEKEDGEKAGDEGDVLSWTLTQRDVIDLEPGMPPVRDVVPKVLVTTLKDWTPIRDWYVPLMRDRVEVDEEIRKRAEALTKDAKTVREKVDAVYHFVQDKIRYVGIELGRSAYQPHASTVCLRNEYGDCKDQSVLVISLLRALDIEAFLALVRPSFQGKVEVEAPSPGQFSHAIVYVPALDLWLDPTMAYLTTDVHPSALDGIQALVVRPDGDAKLVEIPTLDADADVMREVHDFELHFDGFTRVSERAEMRGRSESRARDRFGELQWEDLEDQMEKRLAMRPGYSKLESYTQSDPYDRATPYTNEAKYETEAFFEPTALGYSFRVSAVSEALSLMLTDQYGRDEKRTWPWVSRSGATRENVYKVKLPRGFRVERVPDDIKRELPQGTIELLFDADSNQVEATVRVIRKPAEISAMSYRRVKITTDRAIQRSLVNLEFIDETLEKIRDGRPMDAVAMAEGWVEDDPADAESWHRLGTLYMEVGRFERAQNAFETALKLDPNRIKLYERLAELRTRYAGNTDGVIDHAAAENVYRQALDKVPKQSLLLEPLAGLYTRNKKGQEFAIDGPLDRAMEIYDELLEKDPKNIGAMVNKFQILLAQRKYDAADEVVLDMAEANPNDGLTKVATWTSDALNGFEEEALNQITASYPDARSMAGELSRVARVLLEHGKYQEAVPFLRALGPTLGGARAVAPLIRVMEDLKKHPEVEPKEWRDFSSPEETIKTLLLSLFTRTGERAKDCFAASVVHSDLVPDFEDEDEQSDPEATLSRDMLFGCYSIRTADVEGGRKKVIAEPLPVVARFAGMLPVPRMTAHAHLIKEGDAWKIYTLGLRTVDPQSLGEVADRFLKADDLETASEMVDEMYEACAQRDGRTRQHPVCSLAELDYPDELSRVKTHIAVAISNGEPELKLRSIELFADVLTSVKDDPTLWTIYAELLEEAGAPTEALEVRRKAVALEPDDPALSRRLAAALIDHEEFDTAIELLDDRLADSPNDPGLQQMKLDALITSDQFEPARALLDDLKIRATEDETFLRWEINLGQRKRDPKALVDLSERIRESSMAGRYLNMQGNALLAISELDEALNAAGNQVISSTAYLAGDFLDLAAPLLLLGKTNEVRTIIDRIENFPDIEGRDYYMLAVLRQAFGETDKALEAYTKAREGMMYNRRTHIDINRGLLHQLEGEKEKGLTILRDLDGEHREDNWVSVLTRFLLGKMDYAAAKKRAEASKNSLNRVMYLCELNYYAAVQAEIDGEDKRAKTLYQACLDSGAANNFEYMQASRAILRVGEKKDRKSE